MDFFLVLAAVFYWSIYFSVIQDGFSGNWTTLRTSSATALGNVVWGLGALLLTGLATVLRLARRLWIWLLILIAVFSVFEVMRIVQMNSTTPYDATFQRGVDEVVIPIVRGLGEPLRIIKPVFNYVVPWTNALGGMARIVVSASVDSAWECKLFNGDDFFQDVGGFVLGLGFSTQEFFLNGTTERFDFVTPSVRFNLAYLQLLNILDCECHRARGVWTLLEVFVTSDMTGFLDVVLNFVISVILWPFQVTWGIANAIASFLTGGSTFVETLENWYWDPGRGANVSRSLQELTDALRFVGGVGDSSMAILVEIVIGLPRDEMPRIISLISFRVAQFVDSAHVSFSAWMRYPIRSLVSVFVEKYFGNIMTQNRARDTFGPAEVRLNVWQTSYLEYSDLIEETVTLLVDPLRDNTEIGVVFADVFEAMAKTITGLRNLFFGLVRFARNMLHVFAWAHLWPADSVDYVDDREAIFEAFDRGLDELRAANEDRLEGRREILDALGDRFEMLALVFDEARHLRFAIVDAIVFSAEAARTGWRVFEGTNTGTNWIRYRRTEVYVNSIDNIFFETEAFVTSIANLVRSWSILHRLPSAPCNGGSNKRLGGRNDGFLASDSRWRASMGLKTLYAERARQEYSPHGTNDSVVLMQKARDPPFPRRFDTIEEYVAALTVSYNNTCCEFQPPHDLAYSRNNTGFVWEAPDLVTEPVCCLANTVQEGGLLVALLVRDIAMSIVIPLHADNWKDGIVDMLTGPLDLRRTIIPLTDAILRDNLFGSCFVVGFIQLLSIQPGGNDEPTCSFGAKLVDILTGFLRNVLRLLLSMTAGIIEFILAIVQGGYCSPSNPCFVVSPAVRGQFYSNAYALTLGATLTGVGDIIDLAVCVASQTFVNWNFDNIFFQIYNSVIEFLSVDDGFVCETCNGNTSAPCQTVTSATTCKCSFNGAPVTLQKVACCWPCWISNIWRWIRALFNGTIFSMIWTEIVDFVRDFIGDIRVCFILFGDDILNWFKSVPYNVCKSLTGIFAFLGGGVCSGLDVDIVNFHTSRYERTPIAGLLASNYMGWAVNPGVGDIRTHVWSLSVLVEDDPYPPPGTYRTKCFRPTNKLPFGCMRYKFTKEPYLWETHFIDDGSSSCLDRYGLEPRPKCYDGNFNIGVECRDVGDKRLVRKSVIEEEEPDIIVDLDDERYYAAARVWCSEEDRILLNLVEQAENAAFVACNCTREEAVLQNATCSAQCEASASLLKSLYEASLAGAKDRWTRCFKSVVYTSLADQLLMQFSSDETNNTEFAYNGSHTLFPPLLFYDFSGIDFLWKMIWHMPQMLKGFVAQESVEQIANNTAPGDELLLRIGIALDRLSETIEMASPGKMSQLYDTLSSLFWIDVEPPDPVEKRNTAYVQIDRAVAHKTLEIEEEPRPLEMIMDSWTARVSRAMHANVVERGTMSEMYGIKGELIKWYNARVEWLDSGCDSLYAGCDPDDEPYPRGTLSEIHEWMEMVEEEFKMRERGDVKEADFVYDLRRKKYLGIELEAEMLANGETRKIGEVESQRSTKRKGILRDCIDLQNCTFGEPNCTEFDVGTCVAETRQDALCMVTGADLEDGYCEERMPYTFDGSPERGMLCFTSAASFSEEGIKPSCVQRPYSAVRGLCCSRFPSVFSHMENVTGNECVEAGEANYPTIFTTASSNLSFCDEQFVGYCVLGVTCTQAPAWGCTNPEETRWGSVRCGNLTRPGACCLNGTCLLLNFAECINGTWNGARSCAEPDLPAQCGGCNAETCRRCDVVQNSVNGIVNMFYYARHSEEQTALGACCDYSQSGGTCSQMRFLECPIEVPFELNVVVLRNDLAVEAVRFNENRTHWLWGQDCSECGFSLPPVTPEEIALWRMTGPERLKKWFEDGLEQMAGSLEEVLEPFDPLEVPDLGDETIFNTRILLWLRGRVRAIGEFLNVNIDLVRISFALVHFFDPHASIHDPRAVWYWGSLAIFCDPVGMTRCDRQPHGIGLGPGFFVALGIVIILGRGLRLLVPNIFGILTNVVLFLLFIYLIILLSYGMSPFCMMKPFYVRAFSARASFAAMRTATYNIVPALKARPLSVRRVGIPILRGIWNFATSLIKLVVNLPILPVCLLDDVLELITPSECLKSACRHTCPQLPEIWPCGWLPEMPLDEHGTLQCTSTEPDCCATAPCTAGETVERLAPACYQEPYGFSNYLRVWQYWIQNAGFEVPGTLIEEASFPPEAFTEPRWRHCAVKTGINSIALALIVIIAIWASALIFLLPALLLAIPFLMSTAQNMVGLVAMSRQNVAKGAEEEPEVAA